MGCGALCGDTNIVQNNLATQSKRHYQQLLTQITNNTSLSATPAYSSFIAHYQRDPDAFHLPTSTKLVKGEPVSPWVLLKWRLLLCGLDREDKSYCDCLGLNYDIPESATNIANKQQEAEIQEDNGIMAHDCFVQIEKDIERTFELPVAQPSKRQFERVLKRIANHFPRMGYTQGINFIVSFLVVVGYSENECFEMFVHLACNRRYMLLGMYEDGFPLYSIFNLLFQNALRRLRHRLYTHMFVELGVDPSMWVCKWFMTFYVYSFPKELVKYVWDLVMAVGNLGLIMFAVSLVQQLEPMIMEITELSDLNDFLTSLRSIETFNHYVNLHQLMAKAYSCVLVVSDFEGVDQSGFYGMYIKACLMATQEDRNSTNAIPIRPSDSEQIANLLRGWRNCLIEDRNAFRRNNLSTHTNLHLEIQSFQKSVNRSSNIDQEAAVAAPDDPNTIISTSEMPNTVDSSSQMPKASKTRKGSMSSKSEAPALALPHRVEHHFNQINEKLEEEEQSVASKLSRNEKKSRHSIKKEMDQLDKLKIEFQQEKKLTNNVLRNNFSNPPHPNPNPNLNPNTANTISIFHINQSNSLSLAGRNSLRNDNSMDDVSVSSKHNSNSKIRHQQHLPPKNTRMCACKTKTEENRFNAEQGSEVDESKEQFSDKDSLSNNNFSHNGEVPNDTRSIQGADTHRHRPTVPNEFMVNSHGPGVLRREEGRAESDIEVIMLQFKKNKRARVKQEAAQLHPNQLFNIGWQQQEDSLEEIQGMDGLSVAHSQCSRMGHTCEVESIK